jgi:hypothetical protein
LTPARRRRLAVSYCMSIVDAFAKEAYVLVSDVIFVLFRISSYVSFMFHFPFSINSCMLLMHLSIPFHSIPFILFHLKKN